MKYLLLFSLTIAAAACVHAQMIYTQIGAVGSFYKEYSTQHTYGGQLVVSYQSKSIFFAGAGAQFLRFQYDDKMYYPVYAIIGCNLVSKSLIVSVHSDEGYGFYKNTGSGPADEPTHETGGFYFSPGVSVRGTKRFSPYIDARYTRYAITTKYNGNKNITNINAFTTSIGLSVLL